MSKRERIIQELQIAGVDGLSGAQLAQRINSTPKSISNRIAELRLTGVTIDVRRVPGSPRNCNESRYVLRSMSGRPIPLEVDGDTVAGVILQRIRDVGAAGIWYSEARDGFKDAAAWKATAKLRAAGLIFGGRWPGFNESRVFTSDADYQRALQAAEAERSRPKPSFARRPPKPQPHQKLTVKPAQPPARPQAWPKWVGEADYSRAKLTICPSAPVSRWGAQRSAMPFYQALAVGSVPAGRSWVDAYIGGRKVHADNAGRSA